MNSSLVYRCLVDDVSSCHCTSYERKQNKSLASNLPSFSSSSISHLSRPHPSPFFPNIRFFSQSFLICLYTVLDDCLTKSFAVVLVYAPWALETLSDGKLLLFFAATNIAFSECSNRDHHLFPRKQPFQVIELQYPSRSRQLPPQVRALHTCWSTHTCGHHTKWRTQTYADMEAGQIHEGCRPVRRPLLSSQSLEP